MPTVCITTFFLASLVSQASAFANVPAGPDRHTYTTVRDFPWKDGTYNFGDGQKETFSGGFSADLDSDGNCNVCSSIQALTFGDIDADGREEALMVLSTNLGGAGTMIFGYIFGLDDGVPVLRAEIEGGDRGEGGVESLFVKDGLVMVRRFALRVTDSICCPSRIEIQSWRWAGDRLVSVGKPIFVPRSPTRWSLSYGSRSQEQRPNLPLQRTGRKPPRR